MTDLSQAIREYGQAIRGDWSDIDGRSIRGDLDNIADAIEFGPMGVTRNLRDWRSLFGICLEGHGHWCGQWHGYCNAGTGEYDCNCECTK